MKTLRLLAVSAMVVVALLLGIQASSHAVATLQLTDGAVTVTVADGSGSDANPLSGVVTFIGVVGPWLSNVTTGFTYPTLFSALDAHMDVSSGNLSAGGVSTTLTIMFSEVDFLGPIFGGKFAGAQEVGGTVASGAGNTATFSAFFDDGNALFALTSPLGTMGPFDEGAFSGETLSGLFDATAPFSLTMIAVIHHEGVESEITSFDHHLSGGKVPEPMSLILLGGGLAGAGLYRRLRKPKG